MGKENAIGIFKPGLTPKGQLLLEKLPHKLSAQFPGQTGWTVMLKTKKERETKWILTFPYLDAKVPVSKE